MHPIEHLRYVARAVGEGPALLAREAAGALAGFGDDPAGLVIACRRLVDRQPTQGPIWWLAARVLGAAGDPAAEAWRAADALERDPTAEELAGALADDATVCVLGWPEQAAVALRRRGDVRALVVDAGGEGHGLVRRLEAAGVDAVLVEEAGLGAAAAASDVVVLEASALGPDGLVAAAGSRAAAAVARHAGVPVWAVAGVGRVLPEPLWAALVARLNRAGPSWELADEVVPLDLVDVVVGPAGRQTPTEATRRADCPVVPELLKETR
jgi:hypothetical protein